MNVVGTVAWHTITAELVLGRGGERPQTTVPKVNRISGIWSCGAQLSSKNCGPLGSMVVKEDLLGSQGPQESLAEKHAYGPVTAVEQGVQERSLKQYLKEEKSHWETGRRQRLYHLGTCSAHPQHTL